MSDEHTESNGSDGHIDLRESSTPDEDGAVKLRSGETDKDASGESADAKVPELLPVLPVRDAVAFPSTLMPLTINREKSKRVLDLALAGSRMVSVVTQQKPETEDPGLDDLYRIGTACRILKLLKYEDGSQTAIVHGITRVGIEELTKQDDYLEARVHAAYDSEERTVEIDALFHTVRQAAHRVIELSDTASQDARVVLDNIKKPGALADFVAANLSLGVVHKQEILETLDVNERLRKVHAAIAGQLEVLELASKLQSEVRERMETRQREYYLREQLKAIQSELGESDVRTTMLERLEEKIAEARMPEEVEAEARREMERLQNIPQASPEFSVSQDWIEWLCSLPWSQSTEEQADIRRAERILDKDHYGLKKVKKRILEFLAVRQLKPDSHGPILCFVGPPGVGKTSLGRSIARALNRNFIRMSLGGVHDEADVRGHRRTYIGAMPGRIIQEIRKAASNNPVFMLDEVDKIGQDFRGDPSSALLEVLDPAQNDTFTDHYLDVPFDLSKVMFVATANYVDPIPPALWDRMEVIALPGYTLREKMHIAKGYLIPRQLEENGLKPEQVKFDDEAIEKVIANYTREAGVRGLERKIAALCRSRAAAIVRKQRRSSRVTARSLSKDLGPPEYLPQTAVKKAIPGVVTGLAFTPVGGDILFVEATRMPGGGNLSLTGQLGGVMQESSRAAYSIIRSRAEKWGIDTEEILNQDFHIHVPAGAIPKDGPSAGVTMLTALLSVIADRPVDPALGMTGEITLRGRVLPVGGVREKILAAHRAGLQRVILPDGNMRDLEEIPEDIRDQIEFVPVRTIDQVLKAALTDNDEE